MRSDGNTKRVARWGMLSPPRRRARLKMIGRHVALCAVSYGVFLGGAFMEASLVKVT